MQQRMNKKLLIIETDDVFRRHIGERLRLESYKVFEACEEAEARAVIQKNNIDVVLLGMREAKRKGIALLKRIRELRPLTEVILLTPSEGHSLYTSIEAMKLGAFDDLLMPFSVETLLERVEGACRRKSERERARKPGSSDSHSGVPPER